MGGGVSKAELEKVEKEKNEVKAELDRLKKEVEPKQRENEAKLTEEREKAAQLQKAFDEGNAERLELAKVLEEERERQRARDEEVEIEKRHMQKLMKQVRDEGMHKARRTVEVKEEAKARLKEEHQRIVELRRKLKNEINSRAEAQAESMQSTRHKLAMSGELGRMQQECKQREERAVQEVEAVRAELDALRGEHAESLASMAADYERQHNQDKHTRELRELEDKQAKALADLRSENEAAMVAMAAQQEQAVAELHEAHAKSLGSTELAQTERVEELLAEHALAKEQGQKATMQAAAAAVRATATKAEATAAQKEAQLIEEHFAAQASLEAANEAALQAKDEEGAAELVAAVAMAEVKAEMKREALEAKLKAAEAAHATALSEYAAAEQAAAEAQGMNARYESEMDTLRRSHNDALDEVLAKAAANEASVVARAEAAAETERLALEARAREEVERVRRDAAAQREAHDAALAQATADLEQEARLRVSQGEHMAGELAKTEAAAAAAEAKRLQEARELIERLEHVEQENRTKEAEARKLEKKIVGAWHDARRPGGSPMQRLLSLRDRRMLPGQKPKRPVSASDAKSTSFEAIIDIETQQKAAEGRGRPVSAGAASPTGGLKRKDSLVKKTDSLEVDTMAVSTETMLGKTLEGRESPDSVGKGFSDMKCDAEGKDENNWVENEGALESKTEAKDSVELTAIEVFGSDNAEPPVEVKVKVVEAKAPRKTAAGEEMPPRDYSVLVDASSSMRLVDDLSHHGKSRWELAEQCVMRLVPEDEDGVSLYFFSTDYRKYEFINSVIKVKECFGWEQAKGGTQLADALADSIHPDNEGAPETILIITDGAPDKKNRRRSEDEIRKAAKWLRRDDVPDDQVRIVFLQFGDDQVATRWLSDLSERLECPEGMLTVTSWIEAEKSGMPFDDWVAHVMVT